MKVVARSSHLRSRSCICGREGNLFARKECSPWIFMIRWSRGLTMALCLRSARPTRTIKWTCSRMSIAPSPKSRTRHYQHLPRNCSLILPITKSWPMSEGITTRLLTSKFLNTHSVRSWIKSTFPQTRSGTINSNSENTALVLVQIQDTYNSTRWIKKSSLPTIQVKY